MHHSVFIFSTRSVLLILFYHLTAFGQPQYGDIGQSVLAWMCIPYKNGTFLYQEPVSRAEKSRLVFCFILLSLPGNLKSFLHESQKILSLFTELFTSPANAPVNKFQAFSRKCIFHGGISRITAGKIRTTDITQLSGPKKTFHDIITVCYDYGLCLHCGMTFFLYKVPVIIRGKFIGKSLDKTELGNITISIICFSFPSINI